MLHMGSKWSLYLSETSQDIGIILPAPKVQLPTPKSQPTKKSQLPNPNSQLPKKIDPANQPHIYFNRALETSEDFFKKFI